MKKIILTMLCFLFLCSPSLASNLYSFNYRALITTQASLVITFPSKNLVPVPTKEKDIFDEIRENTQRIKSERK